MTDEIDAYSLANVSDLFHNISWKLFVSAMLMIVVVIVLAVVYNTNNPPERPSYVVTQTYVLSIQRSVLPTNELTTITVSSANNSATNVNALVVDTRGTILFPPLIGLQNMSFRKYSVYPSQIGNYTVLLVDKSYSHTIGSLSFSVVTNPLLSSLSGFVFGKGIAITFGLIAAIITIAYQILSQRKQDGLQKKEYKARWVLDNMTAHKGIYEASWAVCNAFWGDERQEGRLLVDPPLDKYRFEKVFSATIKYVNTHKEFLKNVGGYFFDDYAAEQFMVNIDQKIRSFNVKMGADECPNQYDLWTKETAKKWFQTAPREEILDYYKLHYVYSFIFDLKHDKARFVMYNSESKSNRFYDNYLKYYRKTLEGYIMHVNELVYREQRDLYFSL